MNLSESICEKKKKKRRTIGTAFANTYLPVARDHVVLGGDFDGEEDAADWRAERAANPHRAANQLKTT